MGQQDKKRRKLIANRQKQAKFTAKYGVYYTPSKFIPKETQADMEETAGTEIHTEPEQVNAINESSKPANLDTHAFFQKIENNVLNPKKENKVVVESKPKEQPKPTYSVPPIPGMRSTPKRESIHDAPKLTEEERQAKELADAKVMLEKLKNNYTGTTEERQDRLRMIKHYQDIVDRHRSFDDFVKQTNELAEKTRREAQERAEREKQLKELENASKNDLIKDEENRSPAEKEEIEENKTEQKVEAIATAITNESGAVETVHIPNFYDQFDERKTTGAITERVKAELTAIIKDAGIQDAETADTIAERSYANVLEGLNFDYARGEIRAKTRDAVKNCFDNANLSLRDAGLSMKNRIITAQKIADVMLKNYSPVAFANHLLDHYAEGYVVNDDEFIEDLLRSENVPKEQLESMKQDLQYGFLNGLYEDELLEQVNAPEVQAALANPPEKGQPDQPIDQEQQVNEAQEENIVVVPPQAQIQQEQPPAEQPPAEQPPAEPELTQAEKNRRVFGVDVDQYNRNKREAKPEAKPEEKAVSSEARVAVYTEKLKAYNNMYKLDIDSNDFAVSVIDAWDLMKSGDAQKKENGQKIMGDMVKNILQRSFDVEKNASYKEHRIPEFNEIIKSTNELLRSSMYAFTDLYHDPKSAVLFQSTAFGGLTAKEMTALTAGDSIWKMDQKSDKAWEIQSREAKELADQWLKEDKPYEKMINEMNALIESNKNGTLDRQDMYTKLTAAEWLLVNNEKMMIENPEDPLNPIPNWGTRYWKAIVGARESLGIDRHTSMREMIQGEYAACATAANSAQYNAVQIEHFVQDPKERENYDSLEKQKVEFATQSAAFHISEPPKDKTNEKVAQPEEDYIRKREPVQSEDQRKIMKNEPKVFSNLVIERTNELKIDSVREDRR